MSITPEQIPQTIYKQLGANKFQAMVGASHIVGSKNSLHFSFKGCRKANRGIVTLNSLDLYDMEFFKLNMRTCQCPSVKEYNNLYADQLQAIFTAFTGLYTSL